MSERLSPEYRQRLIDDPYEFAKFLLTVVLPTRPDLAADFVAGRFNSGIDPEPPAALREMRPQNDN